MDEHRNRPGRTVFTQLANLVARRGQREMGPSGDTDRVAAEIAGMKENASNGINAPRRSTWKRSFPVGFTISGEGVPCCSRMRKPTYSLDADP